MYHVLGSEEVEMVVDAPGGNDGRLVVLAEALGLDLLQREAPDLEVFEVAEAIEARRRLGDGVV